MKPLPATFVRTILGVFGDEGALWLDTLPERINRLAERYELTLGEPFDLSYNSVIAVTRMVSPECNNPLARIEKTPTYQSMGRI